MYTPILTFIIINGRRHYSRQEATVPSSHTRPRVQLPENETNDHVKALLHILNKQETIVMVLIKVTIRISLHVYINKDCLLKLEWVVTLVWQLEKICQAAKLNYHQIVPLIHTIQYTVKTGKKQYLLHALDHEPRVQLPENVRNDHVMKLFISIKKYTNSNRYSNNKRIQYV